MSIEKSADFNKDDLDKIVLIHTGTFGFRLSSKDFLDFNRIGTVFEHIANRHLLRIVKNKEKCDFYRSTPGIGTKVVSLDLSEISADSSEDFQFLFSWSPEELSAGIISASGNNIGGKGMDSQVALKVDRHGAISEVGSPGCKVMGMTVISGNSIIVEPTALEQWHEVQTAVNHLLDHQSDKDFLYESIVSGQALSMIITGFENFLKKRFVELEEEGVSVNTEKMIKCCYSSKEREKKTYLPHLQEAESGNMSLLEFLIKKRLVNFQSLDESKKLYKAAYGLIFGEIVENTTIDSIRKYLLYRHRIVHISPIQHPLNPEGFSNGEEPVFANQDTIRDAFNIFNEFISSFNNKTLYLERTTT